MSGRHADKKREYEEILKYGASRDATEAFNRKPYEAIDVATYLEGKGVDTGGQVNTDRVRRHERRDKGYSEKD
ncbi:MAG: hypothetical protein RR791_04810 [Lachnospiraceae bacterium]